jgi:iron complex transport system substrate-binding protein
LNKYNRIISFLPSATEILFEIGLGRFVYGVTHECTFPLEARQKSKVIKPVIDFESLSGLEIDQKIKELSLRNEPIFVLDEQLIKNIQPDIIISQNLCSVCAPFENEITLCSNILGYNPSNLILNPTNLQDILKSIVIIGKELGNLDNATKLLGDLEIRLSSIEGEMKSAFKKEKSDTFPKIVCLDWLNPYYLAGHWVPDMVRTAYGLSLGAAAGEDSRQITFSELEKLNPDKIIIAPCGYDLKRTEREYERFDDPRWKTLRAYKDGQIYLVDSDSYFSKPSPRIITGIEILCRLLHPDLFSHLKMLDNFFMIPNR